MLFESIGVALAANVGASVDSTDEMKSFSLRLPETELAVYDAVGKTMGLNRQDFFVHLLRAAYRDAFKQFVIGYSRSNPSVPLIDLLFSNTDVEEVHQRLERTLRSIVSEVQQEEEEEAQKFFEEGRDSFQYATPMKGILK